MLSSTHKLIAYKVYRTLKEELGVSIDYKNFLYGSIIPDYIPLMMFKAHGKDSLIRFGYRHLAWMADKPFLGSKKNMKEFSFRLRMIMHFVSDCFCHAHNNKRYSNILKHFIYESRLKYKFRKLIRKIKTLKTGGWKLSVGIKDYIDNRYRKYMSRPKTILNDLIFSLNTCIVVSLNVVSACIEN